MKLFEKMQSLSLVRNTVKNLKYKLKKDINKQDIVDKSPSSVITAEFLMYYF